MTGSAARALAVLAAIAVAPASGRADVLPAAPLPSPPPLVRCEAESSRIFGQVPSSGTGALAGVKRLRGAQPKFPELPSGTRGSGIGMHEVLIGPDGKVRRVWVIREPIL